MNGELYAIYHLSLNPTDFTCFQALIAKVVAATEKEPDTPTCEYVGARMTVSQLRCSLALDGWSRNPTRCDKMG